MSWLKHLFGPRRRLAGAMVLATTVALSGSLVAAPASASAAENRAVIVRGESVRTVKLEGNRGILAVRTSGEGRELRGLDLIRGNNKVVLVGSGHRFIGTRVALGRGIFGYRYVLPATIWGLMTPYLGMPFGLPWGYGLGPMVLTTGFGYPGLLGLGVGGFGGVIGLGDRHWLRFHD